MKTKHLLSRCTAIAAFSLLSIIDLSAQSYNTPCSGTVSYTTCSGTVYDPGGTSNYFNGCNGSITLYPATSGTFISLNFLSFQVESGYDNLYIYDGTSTSAPLIGTYTASNSPGTVYANNTSGALTLRFYTDGSVVYSGYEATISCVTSVPQPDLLTQTPTLSSNSVPAGNTVSASCYIYNQGSNASSSNVGYYLSSDTVWTSSDVFLGSSTGGSLNSNTASLRTATLTIPSSTVPGSYYVLYYADYSGLVMESDEANNVSRLPITIVAPTMDLITLTPQAPSPITAGSTVSISCNIFNQGNSQVSSSNVGFYLSTDAVWDAADVYLGNAAGGTLAANTMALRTANVTVPSSTAPGAYYILYYADYSGMVAETNETNNVSSLAVNIVAGTIDLIITGPTVNNSSVGAGGSLTASCYIVNQGNTSASSSNVGYYLSTDTLWTTADTYLGASTGSALAANSAAARTATLTIPAATAPGSYYILYFADYSSMVQENDETNNISYYPITVLTPTIDLIIQSPAVSPLSVAAGNSVSLSCNIYNQGNSQASSSNVGYYLSIDNIWDPGDVFLTSSAGGTLNGMTSALRSASATIPSSTASGLYYILFFADHSGLVSEAIETNNVNAVAITVGTQAQTYTTPSSGSASYTTCSGTVYDPGGTGNYANYCNGTITFTPATAGSFIVLNFVSFSVETCCDYLAIYDGTTTSAPLIGTYTSSPGTVYATNTSGALTLRFYSDYSITYSGYEATISCATTVPQPDLMIQSPTLASNTVPAGNTVNATCNIYNQGSTASSSNVGYYLSADTVWSPADVFIGSSTGGSLNSNSTALRTATLTIPSATAPGSYYVLYYADYSGMVSESDESNNVNRLPITIVTPVIDLVIMTSQANPATIPAGTSVNASCNIYNQGNATASSSNVGFYLSTDAVWTSADVYLGNSTGGTLSANTLAARSATVTIPSNTTPGAYYILYYADYSGMVAESDESNNVAAYPVTVVASTVDLIIMGPTTASSSIPAGGTVSTSCYIVNQGNSPASSSNVGYYLSTDTIWTTADVYLTAVTGGSLPASSSATRTSNITIPSSTTPGSYYILFFADYSSMVQETIETNNVNYYPITVVTPIIDLVMQTQSATPTTVPAGNTVSVTCSIFNQGNMPASSSNVGYYLSTDNVYSTGDVYLSFSSGGTLNAYASANKTATLTIPSSTTPGSYYILYYADYSNLVSESVETNNVSAVAITVVTPTVDLYITTPTASPVTIAQGNTTAVSCYINNSGNSSASSSNVGYYLSTDTVWTAADTYLGFSSGGALAAGGSQYRSANLTIPSATTPGSYYILYFADYGMVVSETNEMNNVNWVAITVITPSIDLVIQSPALSAATVAAGNQVTASCNIYNQGTNSSSSSNVGYYLSTDNVWSTSDVYLGNSTGGTLASMASSFRSATLTIPSSTTPGSYYILYYADYSGLVTETIETNNVNYMPITIDPFGSQMLVPLSGSNSYTVCSGTLYDHAGTGNYSNGANGYTTLYPATSGSMIQLSFVSLVVETCCDYVRIYNGPNTSSPIIGTYTSSPGIVTASNASGALTVQFYSDGSIVYSGFEATVSCVGSNLPDLSTSSQSVTTTSITAGSSVTVSCLIWNLGVSSASSSNVGYYLSTDNIWSAGDVYLGNSLGGALAASTSASRSATVTIPAATAPGSYYILYYADYSGAETESNENNNVSSLAVTITSTLMTVPFSGASSYTVCSGILYDHAGASNYSDNANGYAIIYPATPGSMVQLMFNSFAVETCCDYITIYDGAGTSSPIIGTFSTNPGIIAATNSLGALTVLFYSDGSIVNSGFEASISCVSAPQYPDLQILSQAASSTTIAAGGSVTLSCDITNTGGTSAASSDVSYYLSVDTVWGPADVLLGTSTGGALAALATSPRSLGVVIPSSTASGAYYVLYYADGTLQVSESDEANNVEWLAITVTSAVGIVNASAPEQPVSVYPNPSTGKFDVSFYNSESGQVTMSIYNNLGQVISAREIQAGQGISIIPVDLSEADKGIYLVRISAGGRETTTRVIIQ